LRGVQTSAPSSIKDWFKKEQELISREGARRPKVFPSLRFACFAPNQFFRQLPKPRVRFLLLRVFRDAKNPRQHADDIAVENRRGWLKAMLQIAPAV
jgi:hypothetical protein